MYLGIYQRVSMNLQKILAFCRKIRAFCRKIRYEYNLFWGLAHQIPGIGIQVPSYYCDYSTQLYQLQGFELVLETFSRGRCFYLCGGESQYTFEAN
jgi:hypothetical protein